MPNHAHLQPVKKFRNLQVLGMMDFGLVSNADGFAVGGIDRKLGNEGLCGWAIALVK